MLCKCGCGQEIRKLYKTGKYKQYELAEIFKMNQGQVSKIINNKRRQEVNYKNLNNVFGGDFHPYL